MQNVTPELFNQIPGGVWLLCFERVKAHNDMTRCFQVLHGPFQNERGNNQGLTWVTSGAPMVDGGLGHLSSNNKIPKTQQLHIPATVATSHTTLSARTLTDSSTITSFRKDRQVNRMDRNR